LIASRCDLNSDGFLDNTSIPSSLDLVSSDSLQSYELGGKLSINRRMSMNVSVYHNDWSDIPVVVQPPGCLVSTTINGGKASARGAELESTVEVFEGFRATVGIGYVDSKLTATTSAGRKNDRMNFTPEFNGSLGLEYEFDLVGRESFVRADYTYFGSYYTQTGERGERADAYGVVNLGLGARVSSVADVQLNIKNLLNDDAVLTLVGFPAQYGTRLRPRTVGLHLGYRF
jgi:outer membrane receptor protein involved in Fe transport